jgi:cytochrome c oxidase subunit II
MDDGLYVRGGLMSETETPAQAPGRSAEPNHGLRLFVIWIILALAADLVIWFVWQPHLPPGAMSDAARHQQFDIAVLAVSGAPVVIAVLLYFVYSIVVWRAKPGDDSDGPPIYGNTKVQATWIIGTSAIVLWLAVFGTVELIAPYGAGAGEGPQPIWTPSAKQSATWTPGTNTALQVQVIGQQWAWTYRYPQFGGMESTQLFLPIDTPVTFHVTSLDVIHSFWAYQLGVKADANPGVDNVAYVTPKAMGSVTVRCNELCGIWHAAMFNYGQVVSQTAFQAWATGVQSQEQTSGILAALPPYALVYDPTVIPQLGKEIVNVDGITGAAGYYYGPGNPVTP